MGFLISEREPTQYMTTASVFSKRHQSFAFFMVAWGLIEIQTMATQINQSHRTNGTGQYFALKRGEKYAQRPE